MTKKIDKLELAILSDVFATVSSQTLNQGVTTLNKTLRQVKSFVTILSWSRCTKQAKCTFTFLARQVFMQRQRMRDLMLQARVVVSRLGDNVKTLQQEACCTCSTLIFPHSQSRLIFSILAVCSCRFFAQKNSNMLLESFLACF